MKDKFDNVVLFLGILFLSYIVVFAGHFFSGDRYGKVLAGIIFLLSFIWATICVCTSIIVREIRKQKK